MKSYSFKNYNSNYSDRELEILHLIVYEYSTREIADKLHIGFETVKTHRSSLMSKLNTKNVAGIVREGIRRGLVDVEQKILHINQQDRLIA